MSKDYYKTLEVSRTSTEDEIKKAYRKLAKKYHPDLNSDANAETKFKAINEAYEVLSDSNKKARYDQYGSEDMSGGFGGHGGFSGEDIFSDFFGQQQGDDSVFSSMFNQGGKRQKQQKQNINSIYITFLQSVLGCTYTFHFKSNATCSSCKGKKSFNGDKSYISYCSKCNGYGYEVVQVTTIFGVMNEKRHCGKCNGAGQVISKLCTTCKGNGYSPTSKKLDIKLTAGISDQEVVMFTDANSFDSQKIYLQIHVQKSKVFDRQGKDLYTKIFVNPLTAILGGEAQVPTTEGIKTIKIAAGTQCSETVKLIGHGIKDKNSKYSGNLYVKVMFAELKLSAVEMQLLKSIVVVTPKESIDWIKTAQEEIKSK